MSDTCPPCCCLFRPAPCSNFQTLTTNAPLPHQPPAFATSHHDTRFAQKFFRFPSASKVSISDLSFRTILTLRIGAMAATRGTSLLRLLHQSAVAQAARYQPAGAQLSAPAFGTSPAQSILRRFFADGTQTIDRASVEAGDAAQKGKEFAQEKTEQAKDKASDASETVKEKASDASETAKETASNVTDKVKDTAAGAKEEGESVVEKVKEQASKEAKTAEEMTKDIPAKTKETAQDIKEVGIEAAKAVKRDASKLAEKIGLKTPSEESK